MNLSFSPPTPPLITSLMKNHFWLSKSSCVLCFPLTPLMSLLFKTLLSDLVWKIINTDRHAAMFNRLDLSTMFATRNVTEQPPTIQTERQIVMGIRKRWIELFIIIINYYCSHKIQFPSLQSLPCKRRGQCLELNQTIELSRAMHALISNGHWLPRVS